jgi:hypothetical protein
VGRRTQVVASVGYDQPVMTNVMSDMGHCMSVSAMDNGNNLWVETECTQTVLPAMCREGGPSSEGQAFVATRSYGTAPVTADASALPAFVLLACVMVVFNFVTNKYRMRKRAEGAIECVPRPWSIAADRARRSLRTHVAHTACGRLQGARACAPHWAVGS